MTGPRRGKIVVIEIRGNPKEQAQVCRASVVEHANLTVPIPVVSAKRRQVSGIVLIEDNALLILDVLHRLLFLIGNSTYLSSSLDFAK